MKIEFQDPNNVIAGKEKRSKLLNENSELYKHVDKLRNELLKKYGSLISEKRMDYHMELINANEEPTKEKLVTRAKMLENQDVDERKYKVTKNSIGIECSQSVPGYGKPHVTIAHFAKGVPNNIISVICDK